MTISYQPMQAKLVRKKHFGQKESDDELKPIAFESWFYTTSKNYSFGQLEEKSVPWGIEKFRFHLYRRNVIKATDHQALDALI